jgi:Ca2+:H+ antiporter
MKLGSGWPIFVPLGTAALLVAALLLPLTAFVSIACSLALVATVVAAVHHAEVVAHRVGEPFGTLVLALSITAIELSLIVSLMLAGGPDKAALARDTMFATVMIICNGVIGLCLLLGALRHREQVFRIEGSRPAFAALVTLATLVLVMPVFTTTTPGPLYAPAQLVFVGASSLILWCAFAFFQTVRHRDYFLPAADASNESIHATPPSVAQSWASFGLLLVALIAVVGLAKVLSPVIEAAVRDAGAPPAVVGIVIALIVLMPETWAAARAALANRFQTSMNLAFGSALASIGLTIPAVVLASMLLDMPLILGLEPKDMVLLVLTFLVGSITLGTGRTNLMQGVVLLVVFAAFLFLALVP